jgi:hypothetical protein
MGLLKEPLRPARVCVYSTIPVAIRRTTERLSHLLLWIRSDSCVPIWASCVVHSILCILILDTSSSKRAVDAGSPRGPFTALSHRTPPGVAYDVGEGIPVGTYDAIWLRVQGCKLDCRVRRHTCFPSRGPSGVNVYLFIVKVSPRKCSIAQPHEVTLSPRPELLSIFVSRILCPSVPSGKLRQPSTFQEVYGRSGKLR